MEKREKEHASNKTVETIKMNYDRIVIGARKRTENGHCNDGDIIHQLINHPHGLQSHKLIKMNCEERIAPEKKKIIDSSFTNKTIAIIRKFHPPKPAHGSFMPCVHCTFIHYYLFRTYITRYHRVAWLMVSLGARYWKWKKKISTENHSILNWSPVPCGFETNTKIKHPKMINNNEFISHWAMGECVYGDIDPQNATFFWNKIFHFSSTTFFFFGMEISRPDHCQPNRLTCFVYCKLLFVIIFRH